MYEFHISKIIIHHLAGLFGPNTLTSWLVSSVGRVLHRYRRGHGFKSRTGFLCILITIQGSEGEPEGGWALFEGRGSCLI